MTPGGAKKLRRKSSNFSFPKSGGPRFGLVRLRFGDGTVQAVPVFGFLAVPLQKGFFCVSVEFNRKGRFWFRFRFLEIGSVGSGSAFGFQEITVPTVPVSSSDRFGS